MVGGGIAGLALAAALGRRGIPSVVFEQAPGMRETGAGVQIAPNASRLLHRLGLASRLRETAVRPLATELRRWQDNRLIARTALGAECEQRFGAPYYTVHRADLHDALAALVSPGSIRLGRQVVAVREAAGHAVLHLAGDEDCRVPMVAGADGIRSVVRGTLSPDKPVFSGFAVCRGLVPADVLPDLAAEPAVRLWLGPGRHLVCYPVSAGQSISFAATIPCADPHAESWTDEASSAELSQAFSGWHDIVQRIIAGARTIRRWMVHDRDPTPALCGRRIALVGDAAHPMLPFAAQGANQAIEDAAALAVCLARGGTGALRQYERCRAERTAVVQRQARRNIGILHLPDGPAQHGRDMALRSSAGLHSQAWLYGYDAEEACAAPRRP